MGGCHDGAKPILMFCANMVSTLKHPSYSGLVRMELVVVLALHVAHPAMAASGPTLVHARGAIATRPMNLRMMSAKDSRETCASSGALSHQRVSARRASLRAGCINI